jgi:hypothetical protein
MCFGPPAEAPRDLVDADVGLDEMEHAALDRSELIALQHRCHRQDQHRTRWLPRATATPVGV